MSTDALLARTIPSLINGVSQQPAAIRHKSQAEAQENCLSDVVAGCSRRPPMQHVKKLITSPAADGYFMHGINRDTSEQYVVLIEDGAIQVFDLAGNQKTVDDTACAKTAGAIDYLASSEPRRGFSASTIADFTFIANKDIPVAMSGSSSSAGLHEFLLYVKNPPPYAAGSILDVIINGAATGGSTAASDSLQVRDSCWNNLTGSAAGTGPSAGVGSWVDWDFTRIENNVLYGVQARTSLGANQTVEISDRYGDTWHVAAIHGQNGETPSVQKFSDLPDRAADGFVVEIRGDDSNTFDSYFVKYEAERSAWTETVAPGIDNAFDADTMPHVLVRTPGGGSDFEFKPATWAERTVGSDATESAPEPSFVGKTIQDILLHKNRLTFLSDENVIGSEVNEFFNFWPTTMTTLVESDPLDIAVSTNRVAVLSAAVPFQRNLTLFSSRGAVQAELLGADFEDLTPKNARTEERGTWEVTDAHPVAAGRFLYFCVERGEFTGVWEYGFSGGEADALDVAAHIPTYLPKNVAKIAAGKSENLLVLSSDEPGHLNRLYPYRYWFIGNQASDDKVMSSWSRWTLDDNDEILALDWVGSSLFILNERSDGAHLERMDFRKTSDEGLPYRVHLDSLVSLTGVYSALNDETTWTLPYNQLALAGEMQVVTGSGFGADGGQAVANLDTTTASTIVAPGDWSAAPCLIGVEYPSEYQLSEIVLDKGASFAGQVVSPILTGRLQIRRMDVLYEKTGAFEAVVRYRNETDEFVYPFTGFLLGQTPLGTLQPSGGKFGFDVGGWSEEVLITLRSTSFLPFTFTSIEWEGYYNARAVRT